MISQQEIRNKIQTLGLEAYQDFIIEQLKPSIRLQLQPKVASEIPIGASKMGGCPDVPPNFEWFYWQNFPLSFIAQINLADVTGLDLQNLLPKSGMLYFFYTIQSIGLAPNDKGGGVVYHFDGDLQTLQRIDYPKSSDEIEWFETVALGFETQWTMPSPYESWGNEELDKGRNEKRLEKLQTFLSHGKAQNRLLGHWDEIQGDLGNECEYGQGGVQWEQQDPEKVAEWRLLFQVDSNDECQMMWGDVGRVYFCMREKDLVAQKYDAVWTVMQCC